MYMQQGLPVSTYPTGQVVIRIYPSKRFVSPAGDDKKSSVTYSSYKNCSFANIWSYKFDWMFLNVLESDFHEFSCT